MGYYGYESVKNLSFERVDSRRLTPRESREIKNLMRLSLRADYPDRSASAIENAILKREENRRNLNKTVPGGAEGTWQRYKNPASVLAYDSAGNLAVYLSSADNSSSRVGSRAPRLEIEAKLRFPKLIKSRYHAIGMIAVAPDLRPNISRPLPGIVSIVDVAGFVSMNGKPPEQPFTGYVWDNERWLRQTYSSWGAVNKDGETSYVDEFDDGRHVEQERWSIDGGIAVARQAILSKEGSVLAVQHAMRSAGIV